MSVRNSKIIFILVIVLLITSFTNIQAQDWEENLKNNTLEFLGATAGEVIIGLSSGALAMGIAMSCFNVTGDIAPGFVLMGVGFITGTCVGAPLGTILTAKSVQSEDSVSGAYIGGISGTVIGVCSAISLIGHVPDEVLVPSVLLLPPLCSVIGYNFYNLKDEWSSSIHNNFLSIGLTVLPEKHDNKIIPKIGAKVTVRF